MKNAVFAAIVVVLAVVVAGCMSMPTGLAPSTMPLAPGSYTEMGKARGHAVGVIVLGIAVSEPFPCRAAVDRAIASSGADALVNVSADATQILLGPFTIITTTVQGTAVRVNK